MAHSWLIRDCFIAAWLEYDSFVVLPSLTHSLSHGLVVTHSCLIRCHMTHLWLICDSFAVTWLSCDSFVTHSLPHDSFVTHSCLIRCHMAHSWLIRDSFLVSCCILAWNNLRLFCFNNTTNSLRHSHSWKKLRSKMTQSYYVVNWGVGWVKNVDNSAFSAFFCFFIFLWMHMCVCMYRYIHINIHPHTHVYIHTYIYIYTHIYICTDIYI